METRKTPCVYKRKRRRGVGRLKERKYGQTVWSGPGKLLYLSTYLLLAQPLPSGEHPTWRDMCGTRGLWTISRPYNLLPISFLLPSFLPSFFPLPTTIHHIDIRLLSSRQKSPKISFTIIHGKSKHNFNKSR